MFQFSNTHVVEHFPRNPHSHGNTNRETQDLPKQSSIHDKSKASVYDKNEQRLNGCHQYTMPVISVQLNKNGSTRNFLKPSNQVDYENTHNSKSDKTFAGSGDHCTKQNVLPRKGSTLESEKQKSSLKPCKELYRELCGQTLLNRNLPLNDGKQCNSLTKYVNYSLPCKRKSERACNMYDASISHEKVCTKTGINEHLKNPRCKTFVHSCQQNRNLSTRRYYTDLVCQHGISASYICDQCPDELSVMNPANCCIAAKTHGNCNSSSLDKKSPEEKTKLSFSSGNVCINSYRGVLKEQNKLQTASHKPIVHQAKKTTIDDQHCKEIIQNVTYKNSFAHCQDIVMAERDTDMKIWSDYIGCQNEHTVCDLSYKAPYSHKPMNENNKGSKGCDNSSVTIMDTDIGKPDGVKFKDENKTLNRYVPNGQVEQKANYSNVTVSNVQNRPSTKTGSDYCKTLHAQDENIRTKTHLTSAEKQPRIPAKRSVANSYLQPLDGYKASELCRMNYNHHLQGSECTQSANFIHIMPVQMNSGGHLNAKISKQDSNQTNLLNNNIPRPERHKEPSAMLKARQMAPCASKVSIHLSLADCNKNRLGSCSGYMNEIGKVDNYLSDTRDKVKGNDSCHCYIRPETEIGNNMINKYFNPISVTTAESSHRINHGGRDRVKENQSKYVSEIISREKSDRQQVAPNMIVTGEGKNNANNLNVRNLVQITYANNDFHGNNIEHIGGMEGTSDNKRERRKNPNNQSIKKKETTDTQNVTNSYSSHITYSHHIKNLSEEATNISVNQHKYVCNFCTAKFSDTSDCLKHLKMRHVKAVTFKKKKIYLCEICPTSLSFTNKVSLRDHLMLHTGERLFACEKCTKTFFYKSCLNKHMNKYHKQKSYSCVFCEISFIKSTDLKAHIFNHIKETPAGFQCEICFEIFLYESKLKQHKIQHERDKQTLQKQSSKSVGIFVPSLDMEEHNLHKSKTTEINCSKPVSADKMTEKAKNVGKKINVVEDDSIIIKDTTPSCEDTYICGICSKQFSEAKSLKVHLCEHSKGKKETFECGICGKNYSSKNALEQHMSIHTGEKPYTCDKCSKAFRNRGSLKLHQQKHTGRKSFPCEFCFKSFYTKSALKSHIRVHTGERPYKCPVCTNTFSQSCSLKAHMAVHRKVKPYICEYCSRQFSYCSGYIVHKRIHTGEKPYSCHKCFKRFSQKSALNTHSIIHRPFTDY